VNGTDSVGCQTGKCARLDQGLIAHGGSQVKDSFGLFDQISKFLHIGLSLRWFRWVNTFKEIFSEA